ncbi:preprotein translocase subunit SecD [Candidatus Nanopelagicus hibericus]|uniref:Protein translocase subunit SecD n=1 Tax=Candidatus Nanopelagicus hibericus TaxID=1884915 RepID=A0A249K979_9ACTN|nr:protein translocase subunit SecD [Candidatus Nanopelagicus hibericus]ASY13285.1 preprotein translocase subunit SecD [Candidatus Nanopelagicus hibericus]
MSANKIANTQSRAVRTIAILLLTILGFTGVAFVLGATTFKLGLDLQGGTSVTLQPRIEQGESGKVTAEAIDQAVEIIRQRVNSLGVAESEVSAQGTGVNRQIVISVPGETGRRIVDLVGQTAELRFRPVLAEGAANSTTLSNDTATATLPPGVTPELNTQYAALDCTLPQNRQGGSSSNEAVAVVSCDRDGIAKYILAPAEVLGRQVTKASALLDPQGASGWYVTLDFDGEGTTKFGAMTTRLTSLPQPQNQAAIVLDGLVYSAPRINEPINTGTAQITGNFTQPEAQDLSNVLKYGALPLAFDRGEVQQVSPSLGADQLRGGLIAGVLGLLLVIIYSMLYYRGLGLVSVGSLLVASVMAFLSILLLGETIGFTLTLAGIAGVIVAIGITADSFIVYFERIRDEVREGKSLKSAVETGWVRARRTVIVADAVSMIAALMLYFFAVGGVRGFAFTLGLTTVIDLIVVFFFTKPLVTVLARFPFYSQGHKLSGFSAKSLGVIDKTVMQSGGSNNG